MANKQLFQSNRGVMLPKADTVNHAGGKAYSFEAKQALAQLAATGTFGNTFYASAETQLSQVLGFAQKVEPRFLAQLALYARKRAYMKDMPAMLCAYLSTVDGALLSKIFPKVIDDGKMLRNFVQIMRSGAVGRKSLGSLPKRLVREWFSSRDEEQIFKASVGQDPSFADILKMVHPKPTDARREAFYGYMIGKKHDASLLPPLVQYFEDYRHLKQDERNMVPEVPFQMLTSLGLSSGEWAQVAWRASWQTLRMNLNTFARHGVFENKEVLARCVSRLRDPEEIARARVFPYQLMVAALNLDSAVPEPFRESLQQAMEIAIRNVPELPGKIYVCVDVSGSMSSPVTGYRPGATSAVRCIDVAALVGAAILRKNRTAEVIPFETQVVDLTLSGKASVLENAKKLASVGGGGTNCSAPLQKLNQEKAKGDLVIYVSDNESWADQYRGNSTGMMNEWSKFQARNPEAKLVCIDIQPYLTTQAPNQERILNVGGFSDSVFDVIAQFATLGNKANHWVQLIGNVEIPE